MVCCPVKNIFSSHFVNLLFNRHAGDAAVGELDARVGDVDGIGQHAKAARADLLHRRPGERQHQIHPAVAVDVHQAHALQRAGAGLGQEQAHPRQRAPRSR